MGLSPVTVMVSSSDPTRRSAFTVAANPALIAIPSRRTVVNPASANVTVYVPGRRSTMLYRPSPSVMAVRTFSMSAGLAASTVTPGSTAPDVSLTSPAMLPVVTACARATVGRRVNTQITQTTPSRFIAILLTAADDKMPSRSAAIPSHPCRARNALGHWRQEPSPTARGGSFYAGHQFRRDNESAAPCPSGPKRTLLWLLRRFGFSLLDTRAGQNVVESVVALVAG